MAVKKDVADQKIVNGKRVELSDAETEKRLLEMNISAAISKLESDFPTANLNTEEKDALSASDKDGVTIRKEAMREEAKRLREKRGTKPVTYDGDEYDADPTSRRQVQGAIERAKSYNLDNVDTWSQEWKLADGSFTTVTQADLEAVSTLMWEQMEAAYTREAEIEDALSTAATISDLNAIDVTTGWP